MAIASPLVTLLLLYSAIGIVFGVAFVARGAAAVDPVAEDATLGFRLMILPGAAALWPLLLKRWLSGSRPPTESNAHRDAAGTP